jgi:hypothetical protein
MKYGIGIALALLLLALPATAQKVHVDYDKNADLDRYDRFMFKETPGTSMADTAPEMHERTIELIEELLIGRGMRKVTADPDVYVTYHTESEEEMRLNTTSFGYGYSPSWYWDPYWSQGTGADQSTQPVNAYVQGTLILDIWDAETDLVLWRGTATAVVPPNPEKGARLIEKALSKMAKRFDKMRRQDAKGK